MVDYIPVCTIMSHIRNGIILYADMHECFWFGDVVAATSITMNLIRFVHFSFELKTTPNNDIICMHIHSIIVVW